jgi:predicted ATPase
MIYDIKIVSGYPIETKISSSFFQKTFTFTSGINVLYAQIGSGKSTILDTLKAYTCIPNSGWSKPVDPNILGVTKVAHFPFVLRRLTKTQDIDALVKWDGTPCFHNHSENRVHQLDLKFDDDITTEDEKFENALENYSSGQYIVSRINKILNTVNEGYPKEFWKNATKEQMIQKEWMDSLGKQLPKNKRITLLLDEPEKGLSLAKQLQMWDVLAKFQKNNNIQMIIATHSLAVVGRKDVNIIELEDGYLKSVRESVKTLAKNIDEIKD